MVKKKKQTKKSDMMIKKSMVRDYITTKGKGAYRVSSGSLEALSNLVMDLCDEAMDRASMNRRKTLQAQDF